MDKSAESKSANELGVRLLSASILILLLVLVLIYGDITGVKVITLLASGFCFYEYFNMAFKDESYLNFKWIGAGTGVFLVFVNMTAESEYFYGAVTVSLLVLFIFYLYQAAQRAEIYFEELATTVLGILYITFFMGCFPLVRNLTHGLHWVFLMLIISWGSDLGGYALGKLMGTKKLLEIISPNKTIEGALGGILLSVVAVLLYRFSFFLELRPVEGVFLAVVGSLCAQCGDLFESFLKRHFHAKDSSSLIPGHGGMLDCIDSVFFVAPFLYVYVNYLWR
ncbi:MAG: phosphatidate cytidylyltransferase [Deltaproteobacteria bacterium]|nr:phosphatidate cytidylyltransferase [Deltaproteobacteria bacterium]